MKSSEIEPLSVFERPWEPTPPEFAGRAEQQLRIELPQGHVLTGVHAATIAHRCDCDDVLFRIGSPPHRYAVVHLTYTTNITPDYPSTEIFDTFEDFVQRRLRPDIDDYNL